MLLPELLNLISEAWVIKNKDGREKRFKDKDSAEAKAWKASSNPPPKKKFALYTDEWWTAQMDKAMAKHGWNRYADHFGMMPDDPIDTHDSYEELLAIFKRSNGDWDINDLHTIKHHQVVVDGTTCAAVTLQITYEYDLRDLGIPDDDESFVAHGNDGVGIESATMTVRRDRKTPSKLVLVS